MSRPTVVVGGGYAGFAAALMLAAAGVPVQLFDAASVPGGRARRVDSPLGPLDNGQHLLLGAYHTLLGLIDRLHAGGPPPYRRLPLRVHVPGEFDLRARALPAPLHLLAAVLACRGLSAGARIATVLFWRSLRARAFVAPDSMTVAELVSGQPRSAQERLWGPLCVAALNTRPDEASAAVFLNVLHAAFEGRRDDSDLVVPAVDLSSLLPEPAARVVRSAGGRVDLATPVLGLDPLPHGGWRIRTRNASVEAGRVVLAVGPHQLPRLLEPLREALPDSVPALLAGIAALEYEPIVTSYLRFDASPSLPTPLVQLAGGPGEWLVDRGALGIDPPAWSVVSSAARGLGGRSRDEILDAVLAQLRRHWPRLPPPRAGFVVNEKRATYRCAAGARATPAPHLGSGLHLAGDWFHPRFPATLESAAQSGVAAARAILAAAD